VPVARGDRGREDRRVTYSIVARDPASGAFGVAVQSAYFSVGAVVPWVEHGVGAVATQAMGEVSYGRLGLERMRDGASASDTLAALLAADDGRETRQVAMVDREGRVVVHTGASCIAYAGSRTGDGWSVQANMMRYDTVPDAMAEAFTGAACDFPDRLVAALDAAEAAGGDVRGQQAAALFVSADAGPDLRLHVEDHPLPLVELRRLVQMHKGYAELGAAFDRLQRGELDGLLPALEHALELAPDSREIRFRLAATRALFGDPRGRAALDELYAENPGWRELVPRLAAVGMLPDVPGVVVALS
jgi:uncharacterized Ntn-hydrolase superfamily protein